MSHDLSIEDTLSKFTVSQQSGLPADEVRRRQRKYGSNELVEHGGKSPWKTLLEQFSGTLVIVLLVAAVVSLFMHEWKDAVVILFIVILNAIIGFRQEYNAERAMAALQTLARPAAHVRRDGHVGEVPGFELVPGDIVLLEAGSLIPADGRLVEAANLRIQEATLTGESQAVEKKATTTLAPETALADRVNMAFMGSSVVYGRGVLVVTATGMSTELGKIADMIQTVDQEQTPLQRRLDTLGRQLAMIVLAIVVILFFTGLFFFSQEGQTFAERARVMFLTAVSMAVAAVPEGLPAVVTIALAIGAQRMLGRNAIIRNLPAVETLGSVSTICSDKTGTLTKNQMTVAVLSAGDQRIDDAHLAASSEQEQSAGRRTELGSQIDADPSFALLVAGGALCSDASLDRSKTGERIVIGDPTEGSLVMASADFLCSKEELESRFPRIAEAPFDSERKRMTTVHQVHDGEPMSFAPLLSQPSVVITKGAIEGLLDCCTSYVLGGAERDLDDVRIAQIKAQHDELAEHGMRILGLAYKPYAANGDTSPESLERDLIFLGLFGLVDPPRSEARDAVEMCAAAGIRPVMITGDHPLTAKSIATQLLFDVSAGVLTGNDLERIESDAELDEVSKRVSVFARVSPSHKLRLVSSLQRQNQIIAMTGDGVNDAPALKRADIGVAMGITGADVAKEASDMVLRDDNFATIVFAVREGRIIYDNIRKFIKYTLTSNTGELLVMIVAPLIGMPLPLSPLQILWINLVTDGLPGLALAMEPGEPDTMSRPPHPRDEQVLSRGLGWEVIWIGGLMAITSLAAGYFYWSPDASDHRYWRTMVFTVLTFSQMGNALAIRSAQQTLWKIGIFSNWLMLVAVSTTFILQIGVIYIPVFQDLFQTVALAPRDLAIALAISSLVFLAVETNKLLTRAADR
ncbi:cation-translocating P-type ATPase [Blastopirellula marina]|uniref:ATPase, E1-E2 type n=1 Tax=Blastopirellula marina DSM 3645 TaxID=314230 RepID=A3ZS49_9BACT|nr:cation-translocating P-type ATPase [Blastopirellula marina]EAQ80507.1 ATPase, E1-E2 type [Blastopirellula marina DSM 3645]